MSNFEATVPETEQAPDRRKTLAPRKIDKLDPERPEVGGRSRGESAWTAVAQLAGSPAGWRHRIGRVVFRCSGSEDEQQQARGLRQRVIGAGKPPWDAETAMLVGLPRRSSSTCWGRLLPRLNVSCVRSGAAGASMRPSGWAGRIRIAVAGMAGSANRRRSILQSEVRAVARGGARSRARLCRATSASWLAGTDTGIDIGMPETHVVG